MIMKTKMSAEKVCFKKTTPKLHVEFLRIVEKNKAQLMRTSLMMRLSYMFFQCLWFLNAIVTDFALFRIAEYFTVFLNDWILTNYFPYKITILDT